MTVNGITSLLSLTIFYKVLQQYNTTHTTVPVPTHTEQTLNTTIRPLVICGPSGVGKGTLLAQLSSEYSTLFARSVSHTTRAPRANEINGISYHFTDKATMQTEITQGKFIESAEIHGNIYGQSIQAVHDVCNTGRVCILEIDVQGAVSVSQTTLQPYYIFIQPPSMNELRTRLQRRGSENDETMKKRLHTAETEMQFLEAHRHMFDAVITNNDLQICYKQLVEQLKQWYPVMQKYSVVKSTK